MARRNPGQRQRKMFAEAKRLYELGRSELAAKVVANLAELKAGGPYHATPEFRPLRDSIVTVELRCKRDGYQSARYVGALGSGAGKPHKGSPKKPAAPDTRFNQCIGRLNELKAAEKSAFIQENSIDGVFHAPKKD